MSSTRRAPVVAALVAAVLGLSATPSLADDEISPLSLSQCPSSTFCVWSGSSYSGTFAGTTSTTAVNVGFAQVRSVWNRTSHAARVYSGSGGTGSSVCYDPGDQFASVFVASGSIRVLTTTAC